MTKALFLFSFLLMLFSCADRVLKPVIDQKTGRLKASSTVKPFSIITEKKINLNEYAQFLALRPNGAILTRNDMNDEFDRYLLDAFKVVGGFDNYYDIKGLETFVIEKKLTKEIFDVSSNIGLFKLSKNVGKFLLCDMEVKEEGPVCSLDFKISNLVNNEVLFHVKHYGFVDDGVDYDLFNPVLNRFGEWVKANKG